MWDCLKLCERGSLRVSFTFCSQIATASDFQINYMLFLH